MTTIKVGERLIEEPKAIAEALNDPFVTVVDRLFGSRRVGIRQSPYASSRLKSLFLAPATAAEIEEILSNFKMSAGEDEIPDLLLNHHISILAEL